LSIPDTWHIKTSGNTNKYTILQSVHSCYYLAHTCTCFGIVAIIRELTPRFYYNIQQQYIIYNTHTFFLDVNSAVFVKIIIYEIYFSSFVYIHYVIKMYKI
jgi:hypothetical protein